MTRINATEDEYVVERVGPGRRDGDYRIECRGFAIDVDVQVYGREPRVGDRVRVHYFDPTRNRVRETRLAP